MRRALVPLALLVLAGCGDDDPESDVRSDAVPEVLERIESEADCATLQQEFDTAADNNEAAEAGTLNARRSLAYMQAADDRMAEIGCYDE